ncbi:glycosyltransferase family A protein [Vibrio breoganii]|uniref:glycosyltransferase family A protein n=1 Tax=Vibrio breoganii TaxID=553239 RepID=UPI0014311FAE|nr:glycosyltransferase family A protein [Vibrio breoganii]
MDTKNIKTNDITVSISTFEDRIDDAIKLSDEFIKLGFRCIIIHQLGSKDRESYRMYNDISNIYTIESTGVGYSRNEGIKQCSSKYIWFMDDDVKIIPNKMRLLLKKLDCNFDIITMRILNEQLELRKNYPNEGEIKNKRAILNVGTIEILAKTEFIKDKNLLFEKNIGAGSRFPIGDEAIFLSRALDSKAIIRHIAVATLVHPEESSGNILNKMNFISRGLMLRKVYGRVLSLPIILYIAVKMKSNQRSICINISDLLKGYFSNEK